MEGMRASTEEYALLNARTARDLLGATWGLAETGASGPTGNRYGDSPGHACIAVAGPVEAAITVETGDSDRERNMSTFAKAALDLLAAAASGTPTKPESEDNPPSACSPTARAAHAQMRLRRRVRQL